MSDVEWLDHLEKMQMNSAMTEDDWIDHHGLRSTWSVNYDKDEIIRGIFRQFRYQESLKNKQNNLIGGNDSMKGFESINGITYLDCSGLNSVKNLMDTFEK